ncbi:uncharacterized protein [Ptychodera flava]|uniref:uncharacterized protein n=1 Tax=Ptychodera flava TaxID=63121 RepID=UPI00396A51F0
MSNEAKVELLWWMEQLPNHNGRPIHQPVPTVTIQTDASLQGWGALCDNKTVLGHWSAEERTRHINELELLTVMFAVQSFLQDKTNIHVVVQIDNTTAVAYINHQGGTHSKKLCTTALQIWEWCLQRSITLQAEHIPGLQNRMADALSRQPENPHDYMLNPVVFRQLCQVTFTPTIDLFASRVTRQLLKYVAWKPDPQAVGQDAFTIHWATERPYLFPPLPLIGRCLHKITQDRAVVLFIAPVWANRPWYTRLLQMSVQQPFLLPHQEQLVTNPHTNRPVHFNIHPLAAWILSGDTIEARAFQRKLPRYFSEPQDSRHQFSMTENGRPIVAGVYEGKLIHFQHL